MIIRCCTCHGGIRHGYGGGHPPGYMDPRRMWKSLPSDDRGAFLPRTPPGKIYPRISFSYPVFIRHGCGYALNILYIAVSDVSVLDINNITWWCPPTGSRRCGYHYDDHSVTHQVYHIFIRDGYMVIRYGYLLDNFQVSACAVYPPTGHPKIVQKISVTVLTDQIKCPNGLTIGGPKDIRERWPDNTIFFLLKTRIS